MPNDDIKDDVTEDQVQADQAQAEDDLPEIEDAPSNDEEWTEEDMRLLSDEERAALFGDDEDTGGADAADEGGEQGEPADEAASEDEAQDNADGDDGGAGDDGEQIAGTQAPDVAAIDAEIEAIAKAKESAFNDWEDGELTRDEYLEKLKELDAANNDAVAQRAVAATQEQAVYDAFISTAKGYFSEYPDLATQAHAEAYDRHVRAITGDPRYQNLTHRKMLEAAHRLYAAEAEVLGVDVPAPKGKAKPAAEPAPAPEAKADPAPAPRKRPGDKAPVTLANVPNAAPVSVSDGKYSSLAQRLENAGPEEYERIMASLPPEEAEAFASMDV